jgi:hypothetical protein
MIKSLSRLLLSASFALALGACASHRPLSAFSASRLSARLANDRCARDFGQRPFAADDFEAVLERGRWHWGGSEEAAVDGFHAEVVLGPHGEKEKVVVKGAEDR